MQKRLLKTLPTISTSPSSSPSSSFTVQYLMNSCGLPLETALSASLKLQLDENKPEIHDSVLTFLKSQGFSDAHIEKLVTKYPKILHSRVNTKLKPKIQCLVDNGFRGELLPDLIVGNPFILVRGLNSHLKPSFDLLRTCLGDNEKVIAAVKGTPWLLTSNLKRTLQPNVELLIREGVPIGNIFRLIMLRSRTLLQNVDNLSRVIVTLKKMGLKPDAPMFVYAIRVMVSMNESNWNKKVEVYKSLGWSEEDIKCAFKREPHCLGVSEEKIRSIMDFYVNTMKLEPAALVAYPKLLMYSMDKRIRPRYYVIKILKSKKLLNENRKLAWMLTINEKKFLDDFVMKHLDKVPNLMESYNCSILPSKRKVN